jgi:hypothetical protein
MKYTYLIVIDNPVHRKMCQEVLDQDGRGGLCVSSEEAIRLMHNPATRPKRVTIDHAGDLPHLIELCYMGCRHPEVQLVLLRGGLGVRLEVEAWLWGLSSSARAKMFETPEAEPRKQRKSPQARPQAAESDSVPTGSWLDALAEAGPCEFN